MTNSFAERIIFSTENEMKIFSSEKSFNEYVRSLPEDFLALNHVCVYYEYADASKSGWKWLRPAANDNNLGKIIKKNNFNNASSAAWLKKAFFSK